MWCLLGLILPGRAPGGGPCPGGLLPEWWPPSRGHQQRAGSAREDGLHLPGPWWPSPRRRTRDLRTDWQPPACPGLQERALRGASEDEVPHVRVPERPSPPRPAQSLWPEGAPLPRPGSVGTGSRGCVCRVREPAPDLHAGQGARHKASCWRSSPPSPCPPERGTSREPGPGQALAHSCSGHSCDCSEGDEAEGQREEGRVS